jgi:uncharacterized protein
MLENIPKEKIDYIVKEINSKGKDIREEVGKEVPKRSKIVEFKDITVGQKFVGVVRNVVDFGAFIDIGLHNDGLAHISKISNKFVDNIHDFISVGDIVEVYIIDKNDKKEQVSLSLIEGQEY